MRISEVLAENIFTCDYHSVMGAVAKLYKDHYDVNIWEFADFHDDAAKVLMKNHPSQEELDYIADTGELPERFVDLDFPITDELFSGGMGDTLDEEPASRELCQS